MKLWKTTRQILVAVMAVGLLCCGSVDAKKPDNTGGGGAAYTIIPLPSPDGDGSHYGVLNSISDLGPAGEVHVVGYHYHPSDGDRAYCWTVDATGQVEIEDLSPWFWHHGLSVNSAGVICGRTSVDHFPAVLLPDGAFVVLQTEYSSVRLNNPDAQGVFQVVGRYVMWDVASNGTILATTSLVDVNGAQLHAYDVNDYEEIAGLIDVDNDPSKEQIPAIGKFVDGQLQISTRVNPSPEVIIGFMDMQIDNDGNLLGYGLEPAPTFGHYARAVIWPASGGSIDLVKEFPSLSTAHGDGIATVDGVMQVVGNAHANSGTFPGFYANGELSDLNRLSEGDEPWEIQGVDDINRAGMICGHGRVGKRRNYRGEACLLIPTNR